MGMTLFIGVPTYYLAVNGFTTGDSSEVNSASLTDSQAAARNGVSGSDYTDEELQEMGIELMGPTDGVRSPKSEKEPRIKFEPETKIVAAVAPPREMKLEAAPLVKQPAKASPVNQEEMKKATELPEITTPAEKPNPVAPPPKIETPPTINSVAKKGIKKDETPPEFIEEVLEISTPKDAKAAALQPSTKKSQATTPLVEIKKTAPAKVAPKGASYSAPVPGWYVQITATETPEEANDFLSSLERKGFSVAQQIITAKGKKFYRVLVGPSATELDGEKVKRTLLKLPEVENSAFVRIVE